jgi:hypothetical protein
MKRILIHFFTVILFVSLHPSCSSTQTVKSIDESAAQGQIIQRVDRIRYTADSIVISFYGNANFKKYISLQEEESTCEKYIARSPNLKVNFGQRRQLDFVPNLYTFYYSISQSEFRSHSEITFTLDSSGKLLSPWGKLYSTGIRGLVNLDRDLGSLISADSAFLIAKLNGMETRDSSQEPFIAYWHNRNKDQSLIANNSFDPSIKYTDLDLGAFAWAIPSKDGIRNGVKRIYYVEAYTARYLGFEGHPTFRMY